MAAREEEIWLGGNGSIVAVAVVLTWPAAAFDGRIVYFVACGPSNQLLSSVAVAVVSRNDPWYDIQREKKWYCGVADNIPATAWRQRNVLVAIIPFRRQHLWPCAVKNHQYWPWRGRGGGWLQSEERRGVVAGLVLWRGRGNGRVAWWPSAAAWPAGMWRRGRDDIQPVLAANQY